MNKSYLKIVLVAVFLIFSIICLHKTSYALDEISASGEDINVNISPENPTSYEEVSITLSSYAVDLNKSIIEWRSNKNVVLSGYGQTTYSFKSSGPDTSTIFDVTISAPGSDKITKRIVISPSEIELIWEGVDSYTPPFYRGKSLISREGLIKVIAVPNTNTIKQGKGSISYTWKTKGSAVQNASGYNKDSYTFKNSEFNKEEKISVTAESVDGRYNATSSITIPVFPSKILFYKKSPTEGINYNEALTENAFISEDEVTLVAEPYFLPFKNKEDLFDYTWKINDNTIETPSKKNQVTIRPSSRGGYASIDVTFENLKTLYQKVSGSLNLSL